MVNRMWQHHFGRGIVGTANDFGVMGESPSHSDLLDWLASEFIERRWSMKTLHRLMVTSATYCQSAKVDRSECLASGRTTGGSHEQTLVARAASAAARRSDSRRAVAAFGRAQFADVWKEHRPELPEVLMSSRYSWYADENVEDRNRRSVYVFARRNLRHPLMAAFDPADMLSSCAAGDDGDGTSGIDAAQRGIAADTGATLEQQANKRRGCGPGLVGDSGLSRCIRPPANVTGA